MIRVLGVLILLTTTAAVATPRPEPPDSEVSQSRDGDQAGTDGKPEPSSPATSDSANSSDQEPPDMSELPFNQTKVAHWIETRIATHRLQERVKAHGGGPSAFFQQRDELVRESGWSVAGFTATGKRIRKTRKAIEMSRQDHSDHYPDEIEYMQQRVADTKTDWQDVEPYLTDLQHLTDWVAGNVAQPPAGAQP